MALGTVGWNGAPVNEGDAMTSGMGSAGCRTKNAHPRRLMKTTMASELIGLTPRAVRSKRALKRCCATFMAPSGN